MILRLDPDDDDAEAEEIARIAQEHVEPIAGALQEQLAHVAAAGPGIGEITRRIGTLPTQTVREALHALLRASAGRGVRMGATSLESVMVGVNWQLPNIEAMAWANSYSFELVHGITENSRRVIADALGDWVRDGGPMSDLVSRLEPQFGIVRAEMIAVTESTRAYGAGSRMQYRAMGIRRVMLLTNRDDHVCPICRPYDGRIVDIDQGVPGVGFQPWHPRCRCFNAAYVES